MRCRHLCLLAASGLLASCGASNAAIVFDSTTTPPATTTTDAPVTAASTTPLSPTTSIAVEVSPPGDDSAGDLPMTDPGDEPTIPTAPDAAVADEPTTTTGATDAGACATAGCSGPQIVAYPSLTDVPQLGEDPVRGSGCGLADEFGDSMPDGLYFGSLSPAGGDVSIDVICVYYGESAADHGADEASSAFFPVNLGTRERDVPLAADFVYRVGTWSPDGQCVDAGPAANADWGTANDRTAGWLMIAGGTATGAVALCGL